MKERRLCKKKCSKEDSRNKKIEIEEQTLYQVIKHLGFKEISIFYKQIADEKLDINNVIETYQQLYNQTHNQNAPKRD